MEHGGTRPNAGRKSVKNELAIIRLIDAVVSPDDWKEVFHEIIKQAKEGSLPHAKLMIEYYYGKPVERRTEAEFNDEFIDISKLSRSTLLELESAKNNT